MATSAIRQFITDVLWDNLDYLLIDLPPGTGDIHLTLAQTVPITGAVIVTTPQEVALADARKAIAMFQLEQINIPILGIVENMAYFTPPELPDKKYYIFGQGGGIAIAQQYELQLLGQIPIDTNIRQCGDEGSPAAQWHQHHAYHIFTDIAKQVARQIAIINASPES